MEAVAVQCTLFEISYALKNIWGRHVPSSPVVSSLYIASFRGAGGGGDNKGGEKKRDDYDNNNDDHDYEEEKEDKEERE